MGKKLNVAIIGQGRSGRDIHGAYLKTEAAKELFHVAAVAEWAQDRRQRALEEYPGCEVYENYQDLFNRKDIDLVVNASYSYLHFPISLDCLNHGLNVLVEKPFSKYVLECEKMIRAAKEHDVMLEVFQQTHFAPFYQRIKEIVAEGKLGKIHQIHMNYSGFARRWDWQCSNRYYGGCLLNTGPHPMEMALDLMDTEEMPQVYSVMKKINSSGDAEDFARVFLTAPGKPFVDIEINCTDAYSDYNVKLCGDHGTLKATPQKVEWKYVDDKPLPPLQLASLRKDDGISPAYCSEKLEWHEMTEEMDGDAFNAGTRRLYENVYNHLVNGEELVVKPEKLLQEIQVMELAHAQNPMPTLF